MPLLILSVLIRKKECYQKTNAMEKPKLSLSEQFVLEQIFNCAKSNFTGYHQLVEELKNKVFDAFNKENDLVDLISIDYLFPNDNEK